MTLTGTGPAETPFGELLDAVAAETPAPGGGSAAAWAAALAAGLVEMAAKFTLARDEYAERWERMSEVRARAAELRGQLLALAERELHAYDPVLEALRLPREDPAREERVREASSGAAESPLQIARAAAAVSELAAEAATTGNANLAGDALTAALLGEAACRAAAGLVRINLRGEDAEEPRLREAAMLAKRAAGFGVQAMESTQETKKGKDDA
jgi:formiminotetrahydrofolate cyclodeaminase